MSNGIIYLYVDQSARKTSPVSEASVFLNTGKKLPCAAQAEGGIELEEVTAAGSTHLALGSVTKWRPKQEMSLACITDGYITLFILLLQPAMEMNGEKALQGGYIHDLFLFTALLERT